MHRLLTSVARRTIVPASVGPRLAAPAAPTLRRLATVAASGGATKQGPSGARRALKYAALGLAFAVPAKILYAILPLLGSGGEPSEDVASALSSARDDLIRGENSALDRFFYEARLYSDSIDRLVRDIYVAVMCVMEYQRVSPGEDWGAVHERAARRLLRLCEVNKGVYVKLGQHVAQLQYMLPVEYVRIMSVLTHAAPRDSFRQADAVFRAEFGAGLHEVFDRVDPVPLASASLAQVHVGYMKGTGEKVAIKIQHVGLRETAAADIMTVSFLVHTAKKLFPKFDYVWLAEEIEANLPKELNFKEEAANAEAARRAFKGRREVVIPRIHSSYSSERVLTMSFEEGVYANRVEDIKAMGIAPAAVARLLAEVFNEQIFIHGVVHCDPHAANVLIRPLGGGSGAATAGSSRRWWNPLTWGSSSSSSSSSSSRPAVGSVAPQLVLLDHGLYRLIPDGLRLNYANLWKSILAGDAAGMQRYSESMGAGDMYQLWASMLTTKSFDKILKAGENIDLLQTKGTKEDKAETMGYAKEYADEIGVVLRKIPRELLLILKTNDCLRAVDFALGSPVNSLVTTARYTQKALAIEEAKKESAAEAASWGSALRKWRAKVVLEAKLAAFEWFAALRAKLG